MTDSRTDVIEFDEMLELALAGVAAGGAMPRLEVKQRVLASLAGAVPRGFSFCFAADADWLPHPVTGIRIKVLALNCPAG